MVELIWSCITVATKNLDATSDVCSPLIAPVGSLCRLMYRLLGFCESCVIKKCHGPQLDCLHPNLVTLERKIDCPEGNQTLWFTVVNLKLCPLSLELMFTWNKSSRLNRCGAQPLLQQCESLTRLLLLKNTHRKVNLHGYFGWKGSWQTSAESKSCCCYACVCVQML